MSLINEMLRDLESRRAAELGKQDMQREVRPLPRVPREGRKMMAVALAGSIVAVAAGAGLWAWRSDLLSSQPAMREQSANVPPVASASGPSPQPAEVSPAAVAEALRMAEGENRPAVSTRNSSQGLALSLAETMTLPQPRSDKGEAQPKDEPTSPVTVKAQAGNVPQATPPKPTAAMAPANVQPGNIEKTQILATPRERADAEFRRAQAMIAAGGAQAAVDALQGALRQDPSYSPARQLLLRLLLESRRIDDAMALLQDGLESQPGQVGWAMSLARLQVERGDLAAGERTLSRSRPYAGSSPEFLGFHGYVLQRLGQHKESAEQYLLAARLAPSDGRWWFGVGQALESEGRSEEARGAYRRAVEAGNLSADLLALAEQKSR
ncbi:MAG TPA: tetratricopeptide repeat protein [Rhodocyclaceae bacterium]|nr:tetratricopeptide repeat protein [Rhodocyclaceae bacterium]